MKTRTADQLLTDGYFADVKIASAASDIVAAAAALDAATRKLDTLIHYHGPIAGEPMMEPMIEQAMQTIKHLSGQTYHQAEVVRHVGYAIARYAENIATASGATSDQMEVAHQMAIVDAGNGSR